MPRTLEGTVVEVERADAHVHCPEAPDHLRHIWVRRRDGARVGSQVKLRYDAHPGGAYGRWIIDEVL